MRKAVGPPIQREPLALQRGTASSLKRCSPNLRCHAPLRWPPRRACGAAIPARGARQGQPTVPCSRRAPSTARLCTARRHDRLVETPQPAQVQPPRSQRAERRLAERMLGPARRVPLPAHLSSSSCGPILLPWLCCKPRLVEASPRPHLSYLAASHSACAAACPARSSSCCHPPPDPCRTVGQPLCARCGGVPPDPVTFGLLPCAVGRPCSRSCSGRCAYVRLGGGNRSRPLPHCGCG